MKAGNEYYVETRVFRDHDQPHEAADSLRGALENSNWDVVEEGPEVFLVTEK